IVYENFPAGNEAIELALYFSCPLKVESVQELVIFCPLGFNPIELVTVIVRCMKTGLKSVAAKLMMAKVKWPKGNETRGPVLTQNKRMTNIECSGLEYV
ncbi:hypothetical protein Gotri_013607, partial [Gossypium trilobum]|nr:hypothetical protein [Gossypium trilobum]